MPATATTAYSNTAPSCHRTRRRSSALTCVFDAFDRLALKYCLIHRYEGFPENIQSDIDCIIEDGITGDRLFEILLSLEQIGSFRVVHRRDLCFVIAGREDDGSHFFVRLDFSRDCIVKGINISPGSLLLENRRRCEGIYVPAIGVEFAVLLARAVIKRGLTSERLARLGHLWLERPTECKAATTLLFGARRSEELLAMIRTAAPETVWIESRLRLEFALHLILQDPVTPLHEIARSIRGRLSRLFRPEGISIVLLGPDGAGKSSTIERVGPRLMDVFSRWRCWGFVPSVARLLGRKPESTSQPHALAVRSSASSLLKVGFWAVYYLLSYVALRAMMVRSSVIIYDRHFLDVFVDTRRYRYGGPKWVLHMLWGCMPKPELVFLLDVPSDVVQMRKQEVPRAVTEEQRIKYLALVRPMDSGRVIDGSRSKSEVAENIVEIICGFLAKRLRKRHGHLS